METTLSRSQDGVNKNFQTCSCSRPCHHTPFLEFRFVQRPRSPKQSSAPEGPFRLDYGALLEEGSPVKLEPNPHATAISGMFQKHVTVHANIVENRSFIIEFVHEFGMHVPSLPSGP